MSGVSSSHASLSCQHADLTRCGGAARLAPAVLAHEEVAPFLLSRGVFGPRDVVDGALRVRDVSRRNVVYLAENGDGPAYVLKQGDVAHEARVLGILAGPL